MMKIPVICLPLFCILQHEHVFQKVCVVDVFQFLAAVDISLLHVDYVVG